jgi:hypothetical protein
MRVLIFGTTYVDSVEQRNLLQQWIKLHGALNPACDLMIVDSASPFMLGSTPCHVLQLGDNIGHLARRGQDGWGRAFCAGLRYASENYYDVAVHIEGDSLFSAPVMSFCEHMRAEKLDSLVCGVNGTKLREFAWVETGIMFLSMSYVKARSFVDRYDWPNGAAKRYPNTPEAVICRMLNEDNALSIMSINTMRDDKKMLTIDNVREFDWISHATPEVYDAFFAHNMPRVTA